MDEEFLHYLWKFRLLNLEIKTVSGDPVVVLYPGDHNKDSGPDFINARVKIGETTWAGNVEIHILSSDWFRHGHHNDKAYENIILHVVYQIEHHVNAKQVLKIPTLEMMNQFPRHILERYDLMMRNHLWIPCINLLENTKRPEFTLCTPSLVLERILLKCEEIRRFWEWCGHDWEETFYRFLSTNFGFRINGLPFELLAKSLPLNLIKRHAGNVLQLEALLFGQAGLLNSDYKDPYPVLLSSEYRFFKNKYGIASIPGTAWKFLRLRPSNFPTIRISQFAAFIQSTGGRFFQLLDSSSIVEIQNKFNLSASRYWNDHYIFDRISSEQVKIMGHSSRTLLIINGVVPFLFFIGLEKGLVNYREKAMNLLESLSGESNSDITRWKKCGMEVDNALKTQALTQLKRSYCDKKRCLECRLGIAILRRKAD